MARVSIREKQSVSGIRRIIGNMVEVGEPLLLRIEGDEWNEVIVGRYRGVRDCGTDDKMVSKPYIWFVDAVSFEIEKIPWEIRWGNGNLSFPKGIRFESNSGLMSRGLGLGTLRYRELISGEDIKKYFDDNGCNFMSKAFENYV
jgi:hypothetical protein